MASREIITDIGTYRSAHPHFRTTVQSATAVESTSRKETVTLTTPVELPLETKATGDRAVLSQRRLTQSELYPARSAFAPEHLTALRLLALGVGRSQHAIDAMLNDDAIGADAEVQKIQVLLPELFCCRSLGDGFGVLVNALMSAFEALAGDTPSLVQIKAINKVLALLRQKPFLSADEADERLEVLEASGLNPYPSELLDFLSK